MDPQQFGGGFLEVSAGLNSRTNHVDPIRGNGLDTLFAAGHECEGPERMALPYGAMTGRLTAAATGERQRSRKRVVREAEAGYKPTRTAAQFGSVRAAGGGNICACHLLVIIPADTGKNNTYDKCFK
jgi:hypothetical protein